MSSSPFNPLGPAHFSSLKDEQQIPGQHQRRVGVFFATREGHTKRIANRVAVRLRAAGFDVDLIAVRHTIPFSLRNYSAAVLAASVHAGNHESEMIQFVRDHREELDGMITAFLSVTLSEAGAEREDASPIAHSQFAMDVDMMLNKFFDQTNWHPTIAKPVAGALLYSQYNCFVHLIMKRIAKKEGAATDASHDYVYTDWISLDQFVDHLTEKIRREPRTQATSSDIKTSAAKAGTGNHV